MERDVWPLLSEYSKANFNSHAHVERDDILSDCLNDGEDFNSHAHVERDEVQMSFTEMQVKFQLTRSRGAWQTVHEFTRSGNIDFNSHAHVERDLFN